MPIDFSSMDGYEFEDYISGLFRSLEFEVEATNYSNDGGVDLVATFNKPIFAGKYIIQCKNWTGPVGQPEVRDLYGVVMDQRANKGILITPSDYTQQAYDFANGKNIELINGAILAKIVEENSKANKPANVVVPNYTFRTERYSYYQKMIAGEPNNVINYLQIIDYLRGFVKSQNPEMCTIELFNDIIEWTEKLINRCFKTASKANEKIMASRLLVEALIHCGRVAEATELLIKTEELLIYNFNSQRYHSAEDGDGFSYHRALSWNLYAAFKHIGYNRGCDLITSKLQYSNSILENEYYKNGLLGCLFVYPRLNFTFTSPSKTKHLDISEFYMNDLNDPTFFYQRFYTKTPEEYAQEIDSVLKLNGII